MLTTKEHPPQCLRPKTVPSITSCIVTCNSHISCIDPVPSCKLSLLFLLQNQLSFLAPIPFGRFDIRASRLAVSKPAPLSAHPHAPHCCIILVILPTVFSPPFSPLVDVIRFFYYFDNLAVCSSSLVDNTNYISRI